MTIDFEHMVHNERRKVVKLLQTAIDLDIDIDEYVEVGVNPSNGNTWLFHYDYNFSLFMPIYGDDVYVGTLDNITCEEFEEKLDTIGYDTELIEKWADKVVEEIA